jgi:hypothetical protein
MIRALRLALVWLAMLALPLHGVAGMMRMAACDTMSSGVAAGAASQGSMPMADASTHDGDCCGGMDATAQQGGTVHGKCTPSAACSLVAAPASPGLAVVVGDPMRAASLPAQTPAVAFLTGAPERPPRA